MNALWAQLDTLCAAEILDPIDVCFARFMARLDGRDDSAVCLAATMVSHAAAAGNVWVNVTRSRITMSEVRTATSL